MNDTVALEARVAALETQLQRYKAAFDAISQGVCLFDSEQRVIVGNRPYAEIYGLSPDQIPAGTTLSEITERRAAVGSCPMATGDYLVVRRSRSTPNVKIATGASGSTTAGRSTFITGRCPTAAG